MRCVEVSLIHEFSLATFVFSPIRVQACWPKISFALVAAFAIAFAFAAFAVAVVFRRSKQPLILEIAHDLKRPVGKSCTLGGDDSK